MEPREACLAARLGIVSRDLGLGGRIGQVLLGVLYVVAVVIAFGSLQMSAAFLAVFALISVIAGVTLLTSPLWGAVFLWWFLGIALIVQGVVNILRDRGVRLTHRPARRRAAARAEGGT